MVLVSLTHCRLPQYVIIKYRLEPGVMLRSFAVRQLACT